jgi:ATP-dependent NAD(P)H-hydrate dehydratase
VTICLKGPEDIIADGRRWLSVAEPGALRRSGGLGDILAGTMGVLVHWARLALPITDVEGGGSTGATAHAGSAAAVALEPGATGEMEPRDRALWACAAASVIARRASRRAFAEKRRSMTAPDALGAFWFGGACYQGLGVVFWGCCC